MKKVLWILMVSFVTALAALPFGGPAANADSNYGSGTSGASTGISSTSDHATTSGSVNASANAQVDDEGKSGRRWYNPFSWFRHGNSGVETTGTVNR